MSYNLKAISPGKYHVKVLSENKFEDIQSYTNIEETPVEAIIKLYEVTQKRRREIEFKPVDLNKNGKYDRINQRLDNIPQWAQNRLLIEGDKITLHKHKNQVPVSVYLTKRNVDPSAFGLYNDIPSFFWGFNFFRVLN